MKVLYAGPNESGPGWGEIVFARARACVDTLVAMGAQVLVLDADALANPSGETISTVAAFGPDWITALNLNYLFLAAPDQGSLLDALELPMVVCWDDPLGAVSMARLMTRGGHLGDLNPALPDDPVDLFRTMIGRPLLRHLAWDSGHVAAVTELDLARAQHIRWFPLPTYQPFVDNGRKPCQTEKIDLAFCGNVYPGSLAASAFSRTEPWAELTRRICERKLSRLDRSMWDLLGEEIAKCLPQTRADLGLTIHNSHFWDYYLHCVWVAANTIVRLKILTGIGRPVDVFGLFADQTSVEKVAELPNLTFRGSVGHFTELPSVYTSARINICLSNGLIYQGIPSKLIDCLASGGFALCDPKKDLVQLFGEDIREIFFSNLEELDSKIAFFLERPARRRELVQHFRETILERCTLRNMLGEMVVAARG